MNKSIGMIIALIAGIVLAHYLLKWKKQKEEKLKYAIPLDEYGVPIEPNNLQATDVMLDIQSIT